MAILARGNSRRPRLLCTCARGDQVSNGQCQLCLDEDQAARELAARDANRDRQRRYRARAAGAAA